MVDEIWTAQAMEARVVRYGDLKPCFNAFIDTRTPGSEAKENFTIVGPGVSENPLQHVHVAEPHGFNIGAARQPPGCMNSQHSHDTAEVFVVHSGDWRFDLGVDGNDAHIELHPGDVISLPTQMFRGFTNIGKEIGFLWAILGEDDPGKVTWAPQVFDMASQHGLILMESGRLIDTTLGEAIPPGETPMTATTPVQAAKLRRVGAREAERFVWRRDRSDTSGECLIGPGAYFDWPHGFTLDRLRLPAGTEAKMPPTSRSEVIFVHRGSVVFSWCGGSLGVSVGDTLTVPRGLAHSLKSRDDAIAFVVYDALDSAPLRS